MAEADTMSELKSVEVAPIIGVGALADKMGISVTKVIAELMKNGVMATINEQIDYDTAAIIGSDLGFTIIPEKQEDSHEPVAKVKLPEGEGAVRPPVVAVMGHVDHGKTSLLDAIRQTSVAKGEAGGITQHIGAYQVKRGERWITFLDTPGHEAFSAIRAHGARLTDVAIIVVAADDGVKPQTKEAVRYAQEAGNQIVIAINKTDKTGADPNRVRQELSEQLELVPEEWGGSTVMVDVSAKSGDNVEKLLDMVLLVADVEDLRARPDGPSEGVIIETHLETGRGAVATVLVQNGVLKPGDFVVAGDTYAKVRSLEDWRGKRIKRADPGMPAVITGLKAAPAFGDAYYAVANERSARDRSVANQRQASIKSMTKVKKIGIDELSSAIAAGQVQELNVVVKADVQGSLESLLDSLNALRNDEVAIKVVSSGIGDISESDVAFAATANSILLGFNVSMTSKVKQLASREKVKIRLYKVIYELLDDMRSGLSQLLKPEIIETVLGELKVLGVFKTTKIAVICGGEVLSGKVSAPSEVRIKRGKEIIGKGTLTGVQKEQNKVSEAVEGEQCGLNINTSNGIDIDDRLEFFTVEERERTL